MRELLFVAVLLLLFSAVFLPQTAAEIKSLTISDDSRPVILFEMFGFTHTGHVNVSVSSVSVVSRSDGPIPDPSRLGFFLLSEESLRQVLLEIQRNPTLCILDSHYVIHLFTFRDLSPPPRSRFDLSYSLTSPSGHSLFFANCAPETRVSMEVRTAMYNLDAKGSKDYLPSGLTRLPGLYFFFFLCYWAFLCIWVYICSIDRRLVHRIHLLMAALLLMKTLNLISEAAEKYYVKFTGTPHGWDVLFYIFQFIRTVLLFTVIVSIGNDRSSLQNREKKVVLMIVIPLQVLANIASIVVGKTGPYIRDWVIWNQVFLLADVTCCCVIIFHIVRTIRVLKKTSKTVRNSAKLTIIRRFYLAVIGYLFLTRILVFALGIIMAYKYRWVRNAVEEVAGLGFYTLMFYVFRPVEKNEYSVLDEEDEEYEVRALKLAR